MNPETIDHKKWDQMLESGKSPTFDEICGDPPGTFEKYCKDNPKTFKELMEEARLSAQLRMEMLQRALGEKGKHRHRWFSVGSVTAVTKRRRDGKKRAMRMFDCPICGATKYQNRADRSKVLILPIEKGPDEVTPKLPRKKKGPNETRN